MEEAECPTELLLRSSCFQYNKLQRIRTMGKTQEETEAVQTDTKKKKSASVLTVRLDGEKRGRPVGLPHSRLHVM